MAAASPERVSYAQAQSNIFADLKSGLGINRGELRTPTIGESRIASCVLEVCEEAYQELTNTVGLDPAILEPIRAGNRVELVGDQREALISAVIRPQEHIMRAWIDSIRKEDPKRAASVGKDFYDGVKHLRQYGDVSVTGPVILMDLDNGSIRAFYTPDSRFFEGLTTPLFIPDGQNGWKPSHMTLLIHKGNKAYGVTSQQVRSISDHEWWHVAENLQLLIRPRLLELGVDLPIIRDDKIIHGLSKNLLSPHLHLKQWARIFDLYRYAYETPSMVPSVKNIEGDLFAAHAEFCADIAGGISDNAFSESDIKDLVEDVLNRSLLFGTIDLFISFHGITMTDGGRKVINVPQIESVLKKTPSMIKILRSLDSGFMMGKSGLLPRNRKVDGLQLLADEFLNPGGYMYEKRNEVKATLLKSIGAWQNFSDYRGDPWAALFELSTVPFSDWEVYVGEHKK